MAYLMMSFPLREAASATSWGGTGTYDPACPDPLAPWLGDTLLELDIAQVPRERPQQLLRDEFSSVLPLSEGPLEPVSLPPRSLDNAPRTSPAPTGAGGPRRSARGWQPSQAALENLVHSLADEDHPIEFEDLAYVARPVQPTKGFVSCS